MDRVTAAIRFHRAFGKMIALTARYPRYDGFAVLYGLANVDRSLCFTKNFAFNFFAHIQNGLLFAVGALALRLRALALFLMV